MRIEIRGCMQIQKLNPIGYNSKTEKGNVYKKSNMWTSTALAVELLSDIPCLINPNKKSQFSIVDQLDTLGVKIPQKYKKLVTTAGLIIGVGLAFVCGRYLDKLVNKNRISKADANAEVNTKSAEQK